MNTRVLCVVASTMLVGCTSPALSQVEKSPAKQTPTIFGTDEDIEAKALALLRHYDGIWDARWEWYDEDGAVIGVMTGTEEYRLSPNGYILTALNTVPEFQMSNYGLISYTPGTKEIIFYSVGDKGDVWTMRQDPVTEVMITDPHREADGSETVLRFSRLGKSADTITIQMEKSTDGGDSWVTGFRQTMIRRKN